MVVGELLNDPFQMLQYVHLYGIQVTEIIVRYQINHSPYDNEIGYLGNIEIVAFCIGDPLRRVIPYIGVYEIGLKALRVAAKLKMRPDYFSSLIVIFMTSSSILWKQSCSHREVISRPLAESSCNN